MGVICGKHNTESRVTKIPGGVQFNCAKCDIERAAPALLEALQNLSAAYECLCHQVDCKPETNMHYRAALAAISAARGE